MSSSLLIFIYIIFVLIYAIINKVNCFDAFISGVKEGTSTVINMFSYLLAFVLMINLINASGILEYLENTLFKNTFSPIIFIQMLIRPFSGSSSFAMMLDIYEKYGVDSLEGLFSTFIHTISDSSIYIIIFYFGAIEIKKYKGVVKLGVIINIIGYILALIILYLFFF